MPDRPVLICLPFAGAGASFYKPWTRLARDSFDVTALQLPGREDRIDEVPMIDVQSVVQDLMNQVRQLRLDRCSIFGHSLGAILAYELALSIAAVGHIYVDRLYVSGSPGPYTPRRGRATEVVNDDIFLSTVHELTDYAHEAFDIPELRELLLPVLRADVRMHENYATATRRQTTIPITVLRGCTDRLVSSVEMAGWQEVTTSDLEVIEPDGGHMYLVERPQIIIETVRRHFAQPDHPSVGSMLDR